MARLNVEVAYATSRIQEVVTVCVDAGARPVDAVLASGLADRHAEIDLEALVLGVFGKVVAADALLKDGDRVEIYRRLIADPKDARRARAARRPRNR